MKQILKIFDKLNLLGAYLSSILIVGLVLLILTEIFLRSFFDISTLIADEYSGYIYLATITLALGYTFLSEAHIRINIITSKLSKRTNNKINIYAGIVALGVMIFTLYRVILMTIDSYELEMVSESVSETPIYLTQLALPIGIALFCLSIISYLVKGVKNDK